jgi:MinD superfamily P-loop ATPase
VPDASRDIPPAPTEGTTASPERHAADDGAVRTIRVAVASGKGGTGKTTVSTSLARVMAAQGKRVAYLDCDVEAPNGYLFLSPAITDRSEVHTPVAAVDPELCVGHGDCAKACRYAAILALPGGSTVMTDLCRGCGGCVRACPAQAVREVSRPVGVVESGTSGTLAVRQGRMEIGRTAEHDMVRAVREPSPVAEWEILDSPPGVSCPVVETIRGTDAVLLVTEPTPAGLGDLQLAVELVEHLDLPCGVVINRAGTRDPGVKALCASRGIPVLAEIPNSMEIARAHARGELVVDAVPALTLLFESLAAGLPDVASRVRAAGGAAVIVDGGITGKEPAQADGPVASGGGPTPPELVVLSGKGGTGKTSIAACLAFLSGGSALADADVDAANLHLFLDPTISRRSPFTGGQVAVVDPTVCTGCGLCVDLCRFDALRLSDLDEDLGDACPGEVIAIVDQTACEGCGVCVDACPDEAASLVPEINGELLLSGTRYGPLVHARLRPGQRNSGKLVTAVRTRARALAEAEGRRLQITDGPPGIGCPAIATLTGGDRALLVTEPTLSGLSDLRRIAQLTQQLGVPAAVCVNKVDLSPVMAAQIEEEAARLGLCVLGRVRYDGAVADAHLRGTCVTAYAPGSAAAEDIRDLWQNLSPWIGLPETSDEPTTIRQEN